MDPNWMKTLREYTEALLIALVLALFIRTFVVQAFKIPSGSMLETLLIGDQLLVSKFGYGVRLPFSDKVVIPMGDPKRGDIIVFEYPMDTSKDFIKRIIGLPGDTVEVRDKIVYLNGQPLTEPYVQHVDPNVNQTVRDNMPPKLVPPNHYFVMGDNRDYSMDSRFWGFVDRPAIRGKALILYWSWNDTPSGPTDLVRWNRIGKILDHPDAAQQQ